MTSIKPASSVGRAKARVRLRDARSQRLAYHHADDVGEADVGHTCSQSPAARGWEDDGTHERRLGCARERALIHPEHPQRWRRRVEPLAREGGRPPWWRRNRCSALLSQPVRPPHRLGDGPQPVRRCPRPSAWPESNCGDRLRHQELDPGVSAPCAAPCLCVRRRRRLGTAALPVSGWTYTRPPAASTSGMVNICGSSHNAAMAAFGVRSGSAPFARPTRSRRKRDISANPSERARTLATPCHAEGRGFESLHPLRATENVPGTPPRRVATRPRVSSELSPQSAREPSACGQRVARSERAYATTMDASAVRSRVRREP
jgi:hypothetical protein